MNRLTRTIKIVLGVLLLTLLFSVPALAARVGTIDGPDVIFAYQGTPVKASYTTRRGDPLRMKVDPDLSCWIYTDGDKSGEYTFLGGHRISSGRVVFSCDYKIYHTTIPIYKEVMVYVIPRLYATAMRGGLFKVGHSRRHPSVTGGGGTGINDSVLIKVKNYSPNKIKFPKYAELYSKDGQSLGSLLEYSPSLTVGPYEKEHLLAYVRVRKKGDKLLDESTTAKDFYVKCKVQAGDKTYQAKVLPGDQNGCIYIRQNDEWVPAMGVKKPVFLHKSKKN